MVGNEAQQDEQPQDGEDETLEFGEPPGIEVGRTVRRTIPSLPGPRAGHFRGTRHSSTRSFDVSVEAAGSSVWRRSHPSLRDLEPDTWRLKAWARAIPFRQILPQ